MITLNFMSEISDDRRNAFVAAARRWDTVVDTGFSALDLDGEILTGVRIDVSITRIDGPEGVLGRAGPTVLRPDNELTATGVMEFDDADTAALEAGDRFTDVVLHEMAHVLGFGTLWSRRGLIEGSGSNDPRFSGPAASREFATLGPDGGRGVPIANTGGAGTREGHWRELVFGDELLTGFLSGQERPLSRMSIASFEDIGYIVNYDVANPYALPSFRDLALMGLIEAVRVGDLCRMTRPVPRVAGEFHH